MNRYKIWTKDLEMGKGTYEHKKNGSDVITENL